MTLQEPFTEIVKKKQFNKDIIKKVRNELRNDPLSWFVIIFITLFFTYFLLAPLFIILTAAVYTNGYWFWDQEYNVYSKIFQSPFFFDPAHSSSNSYFIRIDPRENENVTAYLIRGHNYGVFLNTIIIGFFTTLFSLLIGIFTAFIMARFELPGKTIISGFLLIPLILPPFVGGVGFMALLGDQGLINEHFLKPVFGIKIILEGIVAIVFVQTMHYFTLIYLNVYSSMMNADPSMEEAAENLGASRFKITTSVTLPLSMPGIASGSILVFILSMEDLGTPIIFAGFGDPVAQQTITYYIAKHIFAGSETTELAQESAILGAFLLIMALIGFYIIRKYVSLKQYAMVSKGRAGVFRTIKPNPWFMSLIYIFLLGLILTAIIPHIGVIVAASTLPQVFPLIWTGNNFIFLFDSTNGLGKFITNTLLFSGIATILIIILATLAGYVANRKKFKGQSLFDMLVTVPIAIPGIVLGIGYIKQFGDANVYYLGEQAITLNPLAYPPILLVISYTIRKFPFTVRAVYAGLQQTDEVLEEAAINMGASKQRILMGIIIPIIGLSIIAGALISLIYNMSEVSTTLILVNDSTYGTLTWQMADASGKIGELAAIGLFLMTLQSVSLFITNVLLKNKADAITGL